jgi:hypothetical protein
MWAPGQGIVQFPAGMGVPIAAAQRLVVQVHYNLANTGVDGAQKTDSTTLHLRFAPRVDRQLAFLLPDELIQTLNDPTPVSLPPGMPAVPYTWTVSGRAIGVEAPSVDLVGVMPHMHGRGLRQHVRIGSPGNMACVADLEHWSFHWQEFYFYEKYPRITPDTLIQVTCEYDTSADTQPVLPGWGSDNEMCMTALMVALPPS